jgi:hypothetical protein
MIVILLSSIVVTNLVGDCLRFQKGSRATKEEDEEEEDDGLENSPTAVK